LVCTLQAGLDKKKKEKEMPTLNLKKGCPNLVLEGYAPAKFSSWSLEVPFTCIIAKVEARNLCLRSSEEEKKVIHIWNGMRVIK